MEQKGQGRTEQGRWARHMREKRTAVLAALSAAGAYILTNGYRFVNPLFSGDALLMIYQNDAAWQIALGRFAQPVLVFLRGGITSPFLISLLALLWLSLAAFLLAEDLGIRKDGSAIAAGAVLGSRMAFVCANSGFLPWVDFFALALLLSVFGIWLAGRGRVSHAVLGGLSLCISLGIYQAYICVAAGMVLLQLLFGAREWGGWKDGARRIARYALAFAVGAAGYLLIWKTLQRALGIWTANTYNGLADVVNYSGSSLRAALGQTYRNVFGYLFEPTAFVTMTFRGADLSEIWIWILRLCNAGVLAITLAALILGSRRDAASRYGIFVQMLVLLLFPLGVNLVCLLSKGMEHTLMIYAFGLIYVLALLAVDRTGAEEPGGDGPDGRRAGRGGTAEGKRRGAVCGTDARRYALYVLIAVLVWGNVVYANQVYLKKELQETAARSLMTRILYGIESMPGYEPGVTPVAFSGSFERSEFLSGPEDFADLVPYGTGDSILSYLGTDYAYLGYFESTRPALTRVDGQIPEVLAMPCYPAEGSIAYVDGILVVKISE